MNPIHPSVDDKHHAVLAQGEPPVFNVTHRESVCPMVLTCDHASHRVPASLADLGLDEPALRTHVGWDIGAAEVTCRMSAALSATAIFSGYSRLVIDINRAPGHEQSILNLSEHIDIPGNHELTEEEARYRAETYFWPYHRALAELLDTKVSRGLQPILVAIHSFTPVFEGVPRPWEVGVLWDSDEAMARSLITNLSARDLCVGDNEPYDARDAVGYTTMVHAGERGLRNVLIEIRQDLIESDEGAEKWSQILCQAITESAGMANLADEAHE